MAYTSKAWF